MSTKRLSPEREAQIRLAIEEGEIPDEPGADGDIIDGDWQDFTTELLAEVAELRRDVDRTRAETLTVSLEDAARAAAEASKSRSTFAETPADIHAHLGRLFRTTANISEVLDQTCYWLLDRDDSGLIRDTADETGDNQADLKAVVALREARRTSEDLVDHVADAWNASRTLRFKGDTATDDGAPKEG